jgi:hypothetical protein
MFLKSEFISTLLLLNASVLNGQVLLSLIFGDKLNSGNVEFGLDGGLANTGISNVEGRRANALNLGFYFDIKVSEPLVVHTGVIVKSTIGERDIDTYPVGNVELDSLFNNGSVRRRIASFYVPAALKYYFAERFYVEGGGMLGWRRKVTDEFTTQVVNKNDLLFENDVSNKYQRIDAGVLTGVGYRIVKGHGMNLGFRYYQGLVDILKDNPGERQWNSVLYTFLGIPIGAGGGKKKKNTEEVH